MTDRTNCNLRHWSEVIHHRFGMRRSRFWVRSLARPNIKKVAPRQEKAVMNRRTRKTEGRR